jgi:uncharacterized membrane protein
MGRGSSLIRTISKPLAYLYLDFSGPLDSQTNATFVVVCQSVFTPFGWVIAVKSRHIGFWQKGNQKPNQETEIYQPPLLNPFGFGFSMGGICSVSC